MSNMEIKVSFLTGTSFENSILEAKKLARQLDVAYVKYDFNNVNVYISQTPDIENLKKQFNEAIKKENGFVCG